MASVVRSLPLTPLAAAVLALATLAGTAARADDTPVQSVQITARSASDSAGVTGWGQPLSRTPIQADSVDTKVLADIGATSLSDLTRVDASITDSYNAVGYWTTFTVRGFQVDNQQNFRRDGLPINAETSLPLENKSDVEVLKGLSGMQSGTSAPGGIVNLVVKRPDVDLRSATLLWEQNGTVGAAADLSQRFGAQRQFGARLNLSATRLDPNYRDDKGHRSTASLATDWRIADGSLLELEFQQAAVGDAPVGGERGRRAVALVVAVVRIEARGREVQPRAELALRAEALAEIGRGADRAVLFPQQRRAAQVDVRPLDDQVDDAARRAGARLHAAQALEHLDVRLVLQRQRGLRVDRQAVAAEVLLVVDLEAAHREGRPVADGVVRVGDAGVDAGEVGQRGGADVGQYLGVDRVGLDRRARQRLAPAGDAGGIGGAARGDLHALHGRVVGARRGAGERGEREDGRGERRQGEGTDNGSHRALSKRWQGNGVGRPGREWPAEVRPLPCARITSAAG